MSIIYVNRKKEFLFAVVEENFDRLKRLAEKHRFYVWRRGLDTFIVQGSVYSALSDSPFRDVKFYNWNLHRRVLVPGVNCADCSLHAESCGGIDDGIPDISNPDTVRRWGLTAIEELKEISRKETWSQCPMTADHEGTGVTITDGDLVELGFRVVKSHRLLLDDRGYYGNREKDAVMDKLTACGLDEESPIQDIRNAVPEFESKGYGSQRWGRSMNVSDLTFDENLYQINRIGARLRADTGSKTKVSTKEFKDRECSRCVYSCSRPPYDYRDKSKCSVSQEEIVAGEEINKSWMYGFVVGDRYSRSDWKLSGTKTRFGVILGPSRRDEGKVTVVSTVPSYGVIGEVSYDVIQRLHGLPEQTPEKWFDEYSRAHEGLDMRLVHWALRSVYGRRDIYWYGAGRGKRNDVLSVSLASNGTIIFGVDTSNGRGSSSPRFSFRLRYPYFKDIAENLGRYPGSGRDR